MGCCPLMAASVASQQHVRSPGDFVCPHCDTSLAGGQLHWKQAGVLLARTHGNGHTACPCSVRAGNVPVKVFVLLKAGSLPLGQLGHVPPKVDITQLQARGLQRDFYRAQVCDLKRGSVRSLCLTSCLRHLCRVEPQDSHQQTTQSV